MAYIMAKSKLLNISTDLAIDIINLSRKLQQEKGQPFMKTVVRIPGPS